MRLFFIKKDNIHCSFTQLRLKALLREKWQFFILLGNTHFSDQIRILYGSYAFSDAFFKNLARRLNCVVLICRAFPPLPKFRRSPLHSGSNGGHVTTSRHQHPLGAGQFLHISRKCFFVFLYTIRQRKPRPYMFSQASSHASLIAFRLKWKKVWWITLTIFLQTS